MNYSTNDLLDLYADANFYDIEFAHRNCELPFYQSILANRKSVLEVACGTGRLTIPLFELGIPIVGTDISADMINQAQSRARAKNLDIDFQVKQATDIANRHDAIFIATNAFQHFIDHRYALAFFAACRKKLNNNGILIIDLQVPNIQKLSRDRHQSQLYKTFNMNGTEVSATIYGQYHSLAQVYEFFIDYVAEETIIKKKHVAMRMYFPQEIRHLIECSGLKIMNAYGDYRGNPISDDAEKQILVLSKSDKEN